MRFNLSMSFILACFCCVAAAQDRTPPPPPDYPLLIDLQYGSTEAARAAWKPMHDSAPVELIQVGLRKGLRFPCNLQGTDMERASWDIDVLLKMATVDGVQFRFFCPDRTPVASFNIYFRSGNGWYAAPFTVPEIGRWCTVRVRKAQTGIEGEPAGWSHVDRVRISAWRAMDVDTEMRIADFGAVGSDATIVLVRGDYAASENPGEARSISTFTATMSAFLESLGLEYLTVSDVDLTQEVLKGRHVAILPYNPALPEGLYPTLETFVSRGGRLMTFYNLPDGLDRLMQVKRGSHVKKAYEGQFADIRFSRSVMPDAPEHVGQASWNIGEARAIPGQSEMVAEWCDAEGRATGYPAVLASKTGIHMTHILLSDDPGNKRAMLLAMLAHLRPEYGREAARYAIEQGAAVASYDSFGEAFAALSKAGGDATVQRHLREATALRERATELASAGSPVEAVRVAGEAQSALLRVYCAVQEPEPGEFRAFWCHAATGVDGMTWDEAVKNLADNGFTAVLPNMLWGGLAYYDSEVLPVSPVVEEQGDQIALCLAACKKYGVECHVWKVNWNMSSRATPEFVAKMKAEGRVQVKRDGSVEERWLCPSHPANQQLETDSMLEVATKYDVDGIHFDYIRYPGLESCYCKGCRTRFETATGEKVNAWPGDVLEGGALHEKYLEFRRAQITRVVSEVRSQVDAKKPDVKISAAVFRNWPRDRDTVGQDWKAWCDKEYLDFVCPMDYTADNGTFENMVRQQVPWAGEVPLYPGIGLSVWPDRTDVCKVIDQIDITRKYQTRGFIIFNYGAPEASDVVPKLGMGITRKQHAR